MVKEIILIIPSLLFLLTSYGQSPIEDLDFLAGTWKVDGKETYEVWEVSADKQLIGNSYKISGGEKIVTETLSIKQLDGTVVYEATVPNQNDGKTVPFTLNSNADYFSFENPSHDFPTKIIYQKISDTKLVVHVLGADNNGFTVNFSKQ